MTKEQKEKARERVRRWRETHPGYQQAWRIANRQRVNAWQARWNSEHPEKRREVLRASYLAHRDSRLAYARLRRSTLTDEQRERRREADRGRTRPPREMSSEQRESNNARLRALRKADPEKYREIERRTRNANPDKQKAKWQFRRARKRDSKAKRLTPEQRLTLYSTRTCYLCGKDFQPGDRTSVDHIIPLAGGGPHVFENLALTHFSCNSRKGAKSFSHSC
jgi:hypothetical protein